jgi:hypothetical protein
MGCRVDSASELLGITLPLVILRVTAEERFDNSINLLSRGQSGERGWSGYQQTDHFMPCAWDIKRNRSTCLKIRRPSEGIRIEESLTINLK